MHTGANHGSGTLAPPWAQRPESPRKASVLFDHPKTTEAAAFGYIIEVVQKGGHV